MAVVVYNGNNKTRMENKVENLIVQWLKSDDENATNLAHKICVLFSVSHSDKDNRELWDNMQYYMEYCQRNGYVTPKEWIEKHKHF